MDNYIDYSFQLRRELESFPREYTEVMAKRNRDIVDKDFMTYNIGRFLIFLDNFNKGIPDKITITSFGIDGPATTAMVYYDGDFITYVIDSSRYQSGNFYSFYGKDIAIDMRELRGDMIIDYDLITLDNKKMPMLNLWAGFQPEEDYDRYVFR